MKQYDLPPTNETNLNELTRFLYKTIERANENQMLLEKELEQLKEKHNGSK